MRHSQISTFTAWERAQSSSGLQSSYPSSAAAPSLWLQESQPSFVERLPARSRAVAGSPQCQTYSCMELCRAAVLAQGAHTADAAHSRTCRPCLADQTNVYCREEEATNCPSTCLTCLARGGVCEIGFKIQYFLLPTLETAYYLSFFLFTENTSFSSLRIRNTIQKLRHRKAPLITSSSGVQDPACSCKTHLEILLTNKKVILHSIKKQFFFPKLVIWKLFTTVSLCWAG